MDRDNSGWWGVFWLLCCVPVIWGIKSCSDYYGSPEYKTEHAELIKQCHTPVLISEVDDVKLYAINLDSDCDERPVYFSKSGTHTTHTELHGKTSRTYNDDVPAAGSKNPRPQGQSDDS